MTETPQNNDGDHDEEEFEPFPSLGEPRTEQEIWQEQYTQAKDQGLIGEGITIDVFATKSTLREGLLTVYNIANLLEPTPSFSQPPFETKLTLGAFLELAKEHQLAGPAVRLFDLVAVPDLFSGLLAELEKKGIDISEFSGTNEPKGDSASGFITE